jgi:hypothetical protein
MYAQYTVQLLENVIMQSLNNLNPVNDVVQAYFLFKASEMMSCKIGELYGCQVYQSCNVASYQGGELSV